MRRADQWGDAVGPDRVHQTNPGWGGIGVRAEPRPRRQLGARVACVLGACVVMLWSARPAAAQTAVYGYNTATIHEIDQVTGAATTLWTFAPALAFGAALAQRASDGMLFFVDDYQTTAQVWRWDPSTPAVAPVLVGPLGLTGAIDVSYAPRLAFHPNGTLYAMSYNSARLYVVNQVTGAATQVATITGSPGNAGGGRGIGLHQ